MDRGADKEGQRARERNILAGGDQTVPDACTKHACSFYVQLKSWIFTFHELTI